MRAIEYMPDEAQPAEHQAFLAELGQRIGPGQAYVLPNDGTVEWRGTRDDIPVRIELSDDDADSDAEVLDELAEVEIEAMIENPHGDISLLWDPDKAQQQAPQDVWSQNQETYLFIGKGVFLNGTPTDVDLQAARLRSLGKTLRSALSDDKLSKLIVQLVDDGLRVECGDIVIKTRRFPKQQEDIVVRVDRMLERCDQLEKLQKA